MLCKNAVSWLYKLDRSVRPAHAPCAGGAVTGVPAPSSPAHYLLTHG
jgi:hypothetical protein